MIVINYPAPGFRIKKEDNRDFIFDFIRKQWIMLTPEEWVRQNFIQYLVQTLDYPASLIAVEKEIQLGELKKRFDILVYDRSHHPWMMIECKSQDVQLNDDVLHQVLRYHAAVPVSYLVITNGDYCFGWEKREGRLENMEKMPGYA